MSNNFKVLKQQFSSFLCDALCDLVPFVKFQKHEKHPWRSVTFSKVAGYAKHHIYKKYANNGKTIPLPSTLSCYLFLKFI